MLSSESEDIDIDALIQGVEVELNVWLKQERSKYNKSQRHRDATRLMKKTSLDELAQNQWLRLPFENLKTNNTGGKEFPNQSADNPIYFFDRIANFDLVLVLFPIFLVLVFLLNLIA